MLNYDPPRMIRTFFAQQLSLVGSIRQCGQNNSPFSQTIELNMTTSLLIAIVTDEVSDSAISIAEREGIHGATILPASGISQSPLKTFFGLTFQTPMTIVFWIAETETANRTARKLKDELDLDSPQQGLALTLTIDQLFGLNVGEENR